jgi:Flp pilus assembly protein TadD
VLEADLIKVLEKNPEDVRALNALGYTLADRTNRYEDADHYLQRALQLQPDEPVVIDSFGWLLYKKGMADRALPYLKRAYEKQPETEIAAHVIEVLLHLGEKKQARELFEAINKKTPQDEFINKIRSLFQGGL